MINTKELNFLKNVIHSRLEGELNGTEVNLPVFGNEKTDHSELEDFIHKNKLSNPEIITLLLTLIPHVIPDFFSKLIGEYLPNGGDFPEFGGVRGKNHRGILPTGETVLFVLAGSNIEKRTTMMVLFPI